MESGRGPYIPAVATPRLPQSGNSHASSCPLPSPTSLAAVPFDESWRVEVKVRATGTSLGTSDAVRGGSGGSVGSRGRRGSLRLAAASWVLLLLQRC